MADLIISSLRGGMNSTDPSIGIPDDQCVLAQNVEFVDSMLGERRLGTTAITLPATINGLLRVTFLFRHLPTGSESESELWVFGTNSVIGNGALAKKDTAWTDIGFTDPPVLTGQFPYQWVGRSLHGKMFLAYKSTVDRLHVWDGTSLRRVGQAPPGSPPTAANSGGAGTLGGTRYYRQRNGVFSGVSRLSEPTAVLTFNPSGTNASITITKAPNTVEGETHWDLEASLDNVTFYRLARTLIATTTVVDATAFNSGYSSYPLSEDIEDYALIPSCRYLAVDADRLIWASGYENPALEARVGWTPVYTAAGVGNDERMETDTDPFRDLDAQETGRITGLSDAVLGSNWVFKQRAIYKMIRTGVRTNAYEFDKYTDVFGAIPGSVCAGVDTTGQPCIYFLDRDQGPCRLGVGGIKRCGEDLRKTWELVNVDANAVVTSCLYFPEKKQVCWNLALTGEHTPSTRIVLHVDKAREYNDGFRKGWALWTGDIATALCMTLYADNIDANTTRSRRLVPFIGLIGHGLVQRCESNTATDNGTAYVATVTTKPYVLPQSSLLRQFTVMAAVVVAKVLAGGALTIRCLRNFGIETTATVANVSLSAEGSETHVIRPLDNLLGSEMYVAQFQFTDLAMPPGRWELEQLAVKAVPGQGS